MKMGDTWEELVEAGVAASSWNFGPLRKLAVGAVGVADMKFPVVEAVEVDRNTADDEVAREDQKTQYAGNSSLGGAFDCNSGCMKKVADELVQELPKQRRALRNPSFENTGFLGAVEEAEGRHEEVEVVAEGHHQKVVVVVKGTAYMKPC